MRLGTILGILGTLFVFAAASPGVDLTGTWSGSVYIGNDGMDELTLVLTKAEKSYGGAIKDSLGFVDAPITDVVLEGDAIRFAFKASNGMAFAMSLKVDGDKMAGTLKNTTLGEGAEAPIELVRKTGSLPEGLRGREDRRWAV